MDFIIFIIIIACGLFFGRRAEKKHYTSILQREEKSKHISVLSDRDLKSMQTVEGEGVLLHEGTVISIDSFKKLMSSFVNIFGGRMKAYESLVDRARREAVLKVKESAIKAGYNAIGNLRLETSSISKTTKGSVGAVEAMAYATAVNISIVGK